nr:non-ribosomal peptide synthetase [Bacillus wiedmannii]
MYILNNKSICGIGMPGELCIGGSGVSRGYLNRAELTAEKFVVNPYRPNERIYRTGDLARWNEDGNIEYLGRIDEQVKIRGFRIELGEIEERIRDVEGISDAVVIIKENNGDKYLCGYVITTQNIDVANIKKKLGENLPEYMIPAFITQLERLPVTRSGKIDKKGLPEPNITSSESYVPPRDEIELDIAKVFQEILGTERVGIDDSFFELGGDSIKAIRIVSRLREYGYEINVRTIMQNRTIRNISTRVNKAEIKVVDQQEVVGDIELTPIQMDFFHSNLAHPEHFNQSIMLESKQRIDRKKIENTLATIVKHHDMLRAVFQDGKQKIKTITDSELYELQYIDLLEIRGMEDVYSRINDQVNKLQMSMDLEKGPLLKAAVIKTEKNDYLFLCAHHLVVDGVSWRILIEDINIGYNSKDGTPTLPSKTMSYKEWSNLLREYRNSHILKKEIPYWKQIEENVKESLIEKISNEDKFNMEHIELALTQELTNKMLYKVSKAYNTEINDLLLTALSRAVNNVTGKSTVAVNMEGHGRETIEGVSEIDRTVGWFTSVYPVAISDIGKSIREDIRNTKETLRKVPNRGMGYGVLKRLGESVIEGVTPDITFNYLGEFVQENSHGNFVMSDLPCGKNVSDDNDLGTPISFNGAISNNVFHMIISYDKSKFNTENMELMKESFKKELIEVIEHCIMVEQCEHTASDFGELNWSDNEFALVKNKLQEQGYDIERIYPMTQMQEGMLYHKLHNEDSTSYVVQTVFQSNIAINEKILKESFELLVAKHEVLRTNIVFKDVSDPRQVLLKDKEIEFTQIDLTEIENRQVELGKIREMDVRRGFDFEKESFLRVILVKLDEEDYRLIISFHHIIMDGWCLSILMNDLIWFYEQLYMKKTKSDLKESIQKTSSYEDYIRLTQNKDKEIALKYWTRLLEDYEEPAGIKPIGNRKNEEASEEVQRIEISLSKEETQKLEKMSNKLGVTVNTVIETAWGIILQRYNNTQDVIFGKVVSGRNVNLNGIEEMVGLFINMVPVRVKNQGDDSFSSIVSTLQEQALQTSQYDYSSLAEIQNCSILGNDLIQTMIAFENYHSEERNLNTRLNLMMVDGREQTNYALTLSVNQTEVLNLGMIFDTELFGIHEVKRILNRLSLILKSVIENPEIKVNNIELLNEEEKILVLNGFNSTKTEYPDNKTVVELFEEQVQKIPNEIAIGSEDQRITYHYLNERANQVARKLKKLGMEQNQFVAIMAERKIETIIGILGILKAGGAYLPIDPKQPIERVKYILKDSDAQFILATDINASLFNNLSLEKISLQKAALKDELSSNLNIVNTSRDLAYLIYTSGTTGTPKGVMVEHRNINRLVRNADYVDFENVRILQTGSLAFDASTFEIWGALLNGGSLYLVDDEVVMNPKLLQQMISEFAINTMWFTTTLFNHLISSNYKIFDSLDQVLFGGEAASAEHVRQLIARNKKIKLCNGYGPTENTTFTACYPISNDFDGGNIPIGKPISNTQVYVLDNNKICGIGMPGELCVGGDGLSKGYLNRPELMKEKFINNPYNSSEIIYKTGDLVRWLEDGNLEYLGRIDEQVKIRGFRIELGEIENTIRKIEGIRDVSVIVNEEKHEKYLCAYVCYDDGIESRDILNYLKGSLPEYMIPTYIVQLEKLPITRNGKLDRRALPMPEHKGTEQYISPRNKIELVIAEAFQEILGIEQVGIDDSFFRLGGHSLRATRLVNKIEQKLGTRIPLRDVMEEKTVRRISQKLQQSTDLEKNKPIEKQPKKPSYEMSSAQKRLYAIDQIQGENITYNMPGMMRVQGSLDLEKLQQTVNALIKRQEVLRTHFTMKNGQPVQIIEDNVELSVGYRKGNKLNIDKIYKDFVRPFDLNKAPLMRVQIVGISENESILMLDIHHIICDGGSIGVWFEEFSKIYNGEDLPELKVQYKDYSVWQNSNVMKEQKKYWLDEFSGELPLLNLQTDYPRPQKQSFKGNSIKTKLSSSTREAVKLISKETGATEYMVLLSTFMLLLSRYARTEEIIVGTPIAGRTHPETQNMLGMFVNTLAIKGDMQPNLTYLQLIEQLKEKCLKAYDNQEYPFEELIENLDLERDISRNPLFDVMFALQNNEESHLKLGNTKLEQIESESEISKFDLTVSMTEIESGYELLWEYCTDLFKQSTIERMGLHYSELLKNAVENPKRNIYDIPLMGYSEYKKVLEEFNITTTEFPGESTIVELFEKQVEKTPEKVAVISNGLEYTFGYLNKRSNQLAHQLQKLQVQPNDFVGIWATRKIETIIGILAILKAGGAYLPIDPKQPIDRTRYMLRDSRAKVLLTEVENLPELLDGSLTVLNLKQENIYDMSCENPKVMNQTTDLAYLIYTSGTTGEPKGVMVEHRNVIRLVKNTNYVNFHDVGILQTGSLAFDASTFEIWGSLLNGGRLYLVEQDVLMDVEALKQMLAKHRINTMFITTALFNQLVITDCTIFDSLDQLLFGGETTSEEHVKKLVKSNKKLKLSNVYGPTENTTFTTHYPICSEELVEKTPIGKPISNTTVHILNGHNLCGIGIPGELCVGGAGVARGYLNKAELTAEKFVVNPLVPEEKIYRTGDLARWLEDGNIEYLGRIDEQVKIRGFRIELGEIESKLREIPYIQDVAVTLIEKNNDKYLCGYVVSKQKIITEEIKNQLGKTLPQYMVPTYIMQLSALPMTQNRKVNKKELPIPDFDNSNHYVGPRDEIELCVARVFEEILGIERIGIDDSFFELGGDSIKAIRIVSKLRENGYGTDVRNILQNKTIRKICLGISKARNIIIDQSEVTGVAALTPIQIDFFNSQLEKPNHFNQSFMLESSERVNEEHLNKAITAIVEHHDTLRTVFRSGEQVVQSIKESALYDYHSYDYSHIQNKEELYEKINNSSNSIQASFEISEGPLVKVVLFRTKEKDYLLISMHHLVVDGVSWRIIIEDLNKGYTLSKQGNEVILPRKTMSFKLWSEALNKYRESESLKKEIPYWQKVERLVKESKLPTNQLGEKYLPRELVMHLSESETSYLLYQAGRAYNTEINDLLLTAVCRAVNKLDGKETVALNLEGHGREMLDQDIVIDRTVGWFTSVYPVAVTGIGDSITNDIQKTKEALSSIPNKGLGYGVLKALGENVLENVKPDITFNYLGELDQESGSDYFNMSDIARGEEIAIENEFSTGLSINGAVTNKKLRMVIIYNGSNYSEKFMQALNDEFKKQLLVIIEHCIEKRKNEKYIENTRSHLNRDEAITQVIWEEFGLDSILKSITVEKKEHSVLFVTDLSSEKRGEIKGEIINKLSFLQVPDYIVDMNKYPLVSGNMEEEQFISLCSELENTNNISLPKITKDGEMGEVIEGYTPSIMQELFLSTPNTMIEEKIIIEGDYDKDSVIAAIEKVVQEQSILRSTYQKIADRYIICEHGYNTFWKPNYFDLRYATSTYITAVYDLIHGMRRKMSTSILTENNMLSNIVITQKTEREYCIYVIIHHSIWDKASNQIFKEKIIDILNLKAKYVKTNETYKQYVNEVTTSKIYAETHNLSNLEKFKEKTDEYVKRNINNVLEKSVVSLFKMGSATEKLYNDKPWSLFAYILNILARENKLTNVHTEPLPILILQEDRRYMTNDYSNTLGEFLDWLPLLIEGSKENELLDWQQKVNEIQNVKKENHYSLVELLNYSTVEMRNMMASVLSINYQGGFSIEYEEMQEILKNDDYNKSTEVFVNSYSNYLILSYPIFSGCSGDIEEVIQNELNQLEDLLNKKVESEQFEKVVIKH